MSKLPVNFYISSDTVGIAKKLLGKSISTFINGKLTSGIIIETEAYCGSDDKACHAYNNRRTKRTETMFKSGGVSYIYLCYGIHHLLNIVTNVENEPHAILIRGIIAINGCETMSERSRKSILKGDVLDGPGKLTKALGITCNLDNTSLIGETIWIEETGIKIEEKNIAVTPRIGIEYAGEDAKLPYRFLVKNPAIISKESQLL